MKQREENLRELAEAWDVLPKASSRAHDEFDDRHRPEAASALVLERAVPFCEWGCELAASGPFACPRARPCDLRTLLEGLRSWPVLNGVK